MERGFVRSAAKRLGLASVNKSVNRPATTRSFARTNVRSFASTRKPAAVVRFPSQRSSNGSKSTNRVEWWWCTMAESSRTKARPLASNTATTRIPLPRGKENEPPFSKSTGTVTTTATATASATATVTAATKRILFGKAKRSVRQRHLSVDLSSGQTSNATVSTFAAKKTPFQIHCDQKNVAGRCEFKEESGQPGRSTGKLGPRLDATAKTTRDQSSIVGRGTTVPSPSTSKKLLPSRIPCRSRSCSALTDRSSSKCTALEPKGSKLDVNNGTFHTLKKKIAEETSTRCLVNDDKRKEGQLGKTRLQRESTTALLSSIPAQPANHKNDRKTVKFGEENRVRIPSRSLERACLELEVLHHTEYHDDLPIVEQQREEQSVRLSVHFLRGNINAEQRRLVVIFMIRLGTHCRYPSFVVYQAVKLFDVTLDKILLSTASVQLAALASLWIALKRQENFHKIPTATEMLALAKDLYAGRMDLLIGCERKILQIVRFNVTFADPFSLFNHHLISCRHCIEATEETIAFIYHCGGYLIDVTLLDEQFCRKSASLIAAAAVELTFGLVFDVNLVNENIVNVHPRWLFWRGVILANLSRLSNRLQDKEIDRCRITMLRRLLISGKKHYGFEVVYKKYSRSRYGQISECLQKLAAKVSPLESLFDV